MQSTLGILGFVVYIACIVAAAAGVTWLVVRISPAKKEPKPDAPAES